MYIFNMIKKLKILLKPCCHLVRYQHFSVKNHILKYNFKYYIKHRHVWQTLSRTALLHFKFDLIDHLVYAINNAKVPNKLCL